MREARYCRRMRWPWLFMLCLVTVPACSKADDDDESSTSKKKKKKKSSDDSDDLPSPKQVCARLGELLEKDGTKPAKVEKKVARCNEKVAKSQTDEPKFYACAAPCAVKADTMADLKQCEKKCKSEKPSKSEEKPADDDG